MRSRANSISQITISQITTHKHSIKVLRPLLLDQHHLQQQACPRLRPPSIPIHLLASIHYSTTAQDKDSNVSSLSDTLPEIPIRYNISEIRSATNNFLSKRRNSTSTTPSWICTLRNKQVILFQRKPLTSMDTSILHKKMSLIYKSHYSSIIKLLGACISGKYIYLLYQFVQGASLYSSLRNPRIPNFTVLSKWMSRMQVATDLPQGLDYINTNMNFVHNHF